MWVPCSEHGWTRVRFVTGKKTVVKLKQKWQSNVKYWFFKLKLTSYPVLLLLYRQIWQYWYFCPHSFQYYRSICHSEPSYRKMACKARRQFFSNHNHYLFLFHSSALVVSLFLTANKILSNRCHFKHQPQHSRLVKGSLQKSSRKSR